MGEQQIMRDIDLTLTGYFLNKNIDCKVDINNRDAPITIKFLHNRISDNDYFSLHTGMFNSPNTFWYNIIAGLKSSVKTYYYNINGEHSEVFETGRVHDVSFFYTFFMRENVRCDRCGALVTKLHNYYNVDTPSPYYFLCSTCNSYYDKQNKQQLTKFLASGKLPNTYTTANEYTQINNNSSKNSLLQYTW